MNVWFVFSIRIRVEIPHRRGGDHRFLLILSVLSMKLIVVAGLD